MAATALVVLLVVVAGVALLRGARTGPIFSQTCIATLDGTQYRLDPDQAGNAALITAIAVQRGMPARAATIAIATALQESQLRNIDYGDRDSLGLFQQRPSQGWGTQEQIMDPLYSTNTFYDALAEVDGYESMDITVAAQTVQRSGFPDAYATHEQPARAFASALTGHSPGALRCRLRMPQEAQQQPGGNGLTTHAEAVLAAAQAQHGAVSAVPGSPEGTSVVMTPGQAGAPGPDATRRAWSLAQWAVAQADGLHVVSVAVDGQIWARQDGGDATWNPAADENGDGPGNAPGSVLVTVAS